MLELYRKTSGSDREALIHAIGQVIQHHPAPPAVIAQLIDIASGLDLAEVEPQVRRLQIEPFGFQDPLRGAITNYLAFRRLNTLPESGPTPRDVNGKSKVRKAPADRVERPKAAKKRSLPPRKTIGG
jgi:hypothetical protein